MNNPTQQQTVAAQNALTGERTVLTLTIPITGNSDADIISGFYALVKSFHQESNPFRNCQRICEFLAARYKDAAEYQDKASQQWSAISGLASAPKVPPLTSPAPVWTTTGGTTNDCVNEIW